MRFTLLLSGFSIPNDSKMNKCRASRSQMEFLVNFIETHREMLRKHSTNDSKKAINPLWLELSEKLNSIPGAVKDAAKWRKTWNDLKSSVKQKLLGSQTEAKQTDKKEMPSTVEERIYNLSQTEVLTDSKEVDGGLPENEEENVDLNIAILNRCMKEETPDIILQEYPDVPVEDTFQNPLHNTLDNCPHSQDEYHSSEPDITNFKRSAFKRKRNSVDDCSVGTNDETPNDAVDTEKRKRETMDLLTNAILDQTSATDRATEAAEKRSRAAEWSVAAAMRRASAAERKAMALDRIAAAAERRATSAERKAAAEERKAAAVEKQALAVERIVAALEDK